jgi:hypothetical protein
MVIACHENGRFEFDQMALNGFIPSEGLRLYAGKNERLPRVVEQ